MAGRVMHRDLRLTYAQGLPIANDADFVYRRNRIAELELRIVAFAPAALHRARRLCARGDARAAQALQLRDAARVVAMRVRVDDELDVVHAKAERTDALCDEGGGVGQRTVDEHMAVIGGDQDRAQTARADIVGVAEDAKRRLFLVPGLAPIRDVVRGMRSFDDAVRRDR